MDDGGLCTPGECAHEEHNAADTNDLLTTIARRGIRLRFVQQGTKTGSGSIVNSEAANFFGLGVRAYVVILS
jgi:hypothetical protein